MAVNLSMLMMFRQESDVFEKCGRLNARVFTMCHGRSTMPILTGGRSMLPTLLVERSKVPTLTVECSKMPTLTVGLISVPTLHTEDDIG